MRSPLVPPIRTGTRTRGEVVTGMLWLILGMGTGVYALRFVGLALRDVALPEVWERALRFVPVALLTGLVVVGLSGQVSAEPIRLLAVAVAVVVAHGTGRMWACILSGMVAYWLLWWVGL